MNKKAQVNGIVAFVVVVISLLIVAPVLMKIVFTTTTGTINAFGSSGIDPGNKSVNSMVYAKDKFISMFDWIVAFFLIFSIMVLLISSFLIDVHPAFFIIYIVAAFILILFAPTFTTVLDALWTNPAYAGAGDNNVVQYLPITNWIVNNFAMFILGVIALSGLIMFGKYRLKQTGGGTIY